MPTDPKSPPGMASIFANALASRTDQGASVGAGMHNTLECKNCGAARDRRAEEQRRAHDASTPLRCHFCKAALV